MIALAFLLLWQATPAPPYVPLPGAGIVSCGGGWHVDPKAEYPGPYCEKDASAPPPRHIPTRAESKVLDDFRAYAKKYPDENMVISRSADREIVVKMDGKVFIDGLLFGYRQLEECHKDGSDAGCCIAHPNIEGIGSVSVVTCPTGKGKRIDIAPQAKPSPILDGPLMKSMAQQGWKCVITPDQNHLACDKRR